MIQILCNLRCKVLLCTSYFSDLALFSLILEELLEICSIIETIRSDVFVELLKVFLVGKVFLGVGKCLMLMLLPKADTPSGQLSSYRHIYLSETVLRMLERAF